MNILYGLAGEGTGHATRSKAVIEHLLAAGHSVKIVASKRAYKFLRETPEFDITEIVGLELVYTDGALDLARTSMLNLANGSRMLAVNLPVMSGLDLLGIDVVISDFEPMASMYARSRGLPIFSIDSLQIINRCIHPIEITQGREHEYELTRAAVGAISPLCDYYVITTFFYPSIRPEYADTTVLVPPILREAVLQAKPITGDAVLVYLTQSSDSSLFDTLGAFPQQKFLVYGIDDNGSVPKNCTMRPASERGFLDDLISAQAVVTSGGVTLPHESIWLEKPVYSVPVQNHFEQIMNARYLALYGYGVTSDRFDPQTLDVFLTNTKRYVDAIRSSARQDGNRVTFEVVDGLLAG